MKLKEILTRIKGIKNIEIIIAAILVVAILLIYFMPGNDQGGLTKNATVVSSDEEPEEAQRLAQTLSQIKGAGNVKVMITYESNGEIVPAYQQDITESGNTSGNQVTYSKTQSNKIITVNQQGGAGALIIKEKKPEIKGVIVIAEGAADLKVKLSLYKAVQTVLQVNATKVDIFEMK